jgi:hypothetical protein
MHKGIYVHLIKLLAVLGVRLGSLHHGGVTYCLLTGLRVRLHVVHKQREGLPKTAIIGPGS